MKMKKILLALLLTLVALTSVGVAQAAGPTFAALVDSNQVAKDGIAFNLATVLADQPDNGVAAYTISASPTLTGLTISQAGVISVTPTIAQAGTYTVAATVSDTDSTDSTTFTLTVINSGPILANIADQTADEGREFSYQTSLATQLDNGPITYSVSALPAVTGLTISNTGKITATATHSEIGEHTVTVSVKDGDNIVKTKTFKLTVRNVIPDLSKAKIGARDVAVLSTTNEVIAASNSATNVILLTANVPYQDNIVAKSATDPIDPGTASGDAVSYESSGDWSTFTISSGGLISFTPTDDDAGLHYVTITAKDGNNEESSKTIRFFVKSSTDDDKLLIKNVDVEDITGADDETQPTDTLKVTFDVSNMLTTELQNIKVKIWVEDSTGKRFSDRTSTDSFDLAGKELNENNEFELVVSEDAKKSVSISSYYLVRIDAAGEDEAGTTHSDIYFKEFKVFREDHSVIIQDVAITPESATCGGSAEFAIRTTNIGSTEETVRLNIKNTALGVNVDSGSITLKKDGSESSKVTKLAASIPATAISDSYSFDVKTTFNDGKDQITTVETLKVACETAPISVNQTESDIVSLAQSSQTVNRGSTGKYTVTLTNTQSTTQIFKVDVSGAQDWATVTVENGEATLAPGASSPAYVYVTPKSDANAGQHTATVIVTAGANVVGSKALTTTVGVPTTTVTDYSRTGATSTAIAMPSWTNVGFAALFVVVVVLAGVLFSARNGKGKPERY